MMGGTNFLGLILVWALVAGKGRTQVLPYQGEDQVLTGGSNLLTASLPNSGSQQEPQAAQRRLSLEDFFLNRNNQGQQQQVQPAQQQIQPLQQLPQPQFQVQQSDPNSVVLVRDSQFPSENGGVLSRLMMLRRMLRLRRWARRLSFIPRLIRLGAQTSSLRQASEPQPVVLLNNRIGQSYNDEPYDPRDYVLGNKGFSYNNTGSKQEKEYRGGQPKQETDAYSREVEPYYDTVNDLPYDLYDNKNIKASKNYRTEGASLQNQNKYKQASNVNINDDRQLQAFDIAKSLQEKLQSLRDIQQNQQFSNYLQNNQNPNHISQQQNNDIHSSQIYPQSSQEDSYLRNKQVYDGNSQQNSHANRHQQNHQAQDSSNQYNNPLGNNRYEGNQGQDDQQHQLLREQQLQLLRQQQLLQLLRKQQLHLARERQFQLQQQGNSYQQQPQQYQNQQSQIESEAPIQNYPGQYHLQPQDNSLYEEQQNYGKTEKNGYEKPLIVDTNSIGSATGLGSGANVIGVGVNVGIKPPAVGIAVTKPVSPVIKPLPQIANSIFSKPISSPVGDEHLVPLGFLPKPLLNLNGRVFFGAEVGKGVKVGR